MSGNAERAAELVRTATTEGPDAGRRLAQRERLIRASADAVPTSPRRWPWAVAFAAMALVLVVVGAYWTAARSVTPEVLDEADAPLRVAFNDGSRVELAEGASGRVANNGPKTVDIVLDSGRLDATVEPATKRTWTVTAGPYAVQVVGTIFSVDWDPETDALEVKVTRGEVLVTGGPSLAERGLAVRAGHVLQASPTTVTLTGSPTAPPEPNPVPVPVPVPVPDDDEPASTPLPDPPTPSPTKPHAKKPTPTPSPTWKSVANEGRYADALALAKARGFDGLLDSLGRDDLSELADTARLGKDATLAKKAYRAVRQRFPNTTAAARAAFQLGRLSPKTSKGHRDAIGWFRTYLDERPSGAYVREARGRLLQSLLAVNERAAAKAVAERYLDAHPEGPHAKLARSIVE